ncbi:hypothetical protein ACFQ0B_51635 [Nonomuraea thailandensis]
MTTPVVLVAGPYAGARAAVVRRLLADHPGSVAIRHDLGPGPLPGAALLVLELADTAEPRPFAEAVAARAGLRLAAVLTALDARHMPVDILRGDRLPGRDERYVAEVLARQVEYATHLVLDGGDAEDGELARTVLAHLAPATPSTTCATACPGWRAGRRARGSWPTASIPPPRCCPARPGPARSPRSSGTGCGPCTPAACSRSPRSWPPARYAAAAASGWPARPPAGLGLGGGPAHRARRRPWLAARPRRRGTPAARPAAPRPPSTGTR